MTQLKDLAQVIRSKNSGPFEITFDIIFSDPATYRRVERSGVLTPELICRLYGVPKENIVALLFFQPALAFKFTLRRGWAQGSINERDTFGAQQHVPLMTIDIPNEDGPSTMNATSKGEAAALSQTESEKIAQFALNLQLEDVPPDVLALASEHFLDVIGIALASSKFDIGRSVLKGAQELGEGSAASAIGSGARLPAASAALVNGVLAHALDFDDTHIGAIYHASAQAMAATLAAGQANGSSGKEVLLAFIAALESGCRLGTVGAPDFHNRGFHPTALCGTFAAAAAAGRLYKIDQQQLVWSLGLCGSQASGLLIGGLHWLKRLHPGWSAHSALASVALARAGFIGPNTVFEATKGGFYLTHIQRIPEGDELPSHQLGQTWQTLGIALKPYPCCHFIHAFVDAALELRGQFDPDDIERIDCPLTADLHKMVAEPREACIKPAIPYRALFSVQYVVALALARGRVDLAAFHDEPLDAPDVLAIAAKTFCIDDPASDFPKRFPGEVIVHLKDGRIVRARKPASLGTPDVPLSTAALKAKFMSNATRAISRQAAEQLIDRVLNLEAETSLDEVMALCVAESA